MSKERFEALLQVQPQYDSHDLWEALAEQENLQYEVLELSMPLALKKGGRFLSEELSADPAAVWYRKNQRTRSVHGAFIDINPASGDPELRELSRRRCRESCETAVFVGACNIIFHSSCFPFLRGSYLDDWAGQCAEFYEELAGSYGLNIYIENSMDVNAQPLQELMRRISNPAIGVCLDVGHANYSRIPMENWLTCLGDRIGYLHLSDNYGLYDEHMNLGKGIAELDLADRFWRDKGKTMPVTLEVNGIEGVKESLSYLRKHGLFGCTEESRGQVP